MVSTKHFRRWTRVTLSGLAVATGLFVASNFATRAQAEPTVASSGPKIKSVLEAFRVTRVDGKEKLVSATTAKPGDLIEYQVRYINEGKASASALKASLPVPDQMAYVANSAAPDEVLASTDEKNFAPAPLKRTVKVNGVAKVVLVPLSEYRALRWNLGVLKPGATALVKSRMMIKSVGKAAKAS